MKEITDEMLEEFPFLYCSDDNEWCYGNSDGINWFNNVDKGWRELVYNMFKEIKDILVKYDCVDKFVIHQLKEKYAGLRLYYGGELPRDCFLEIDEIVNKYEDESYETCIVCGNKAKYYTKGYILPYCKKCVKPEWKISEIK